MASEKLLELQNHKVSELREHAKNLRRQADVVDNQADTIQLKVMAAFVREYSDRLITKSEAIGLLWFNHYSTLREWEKKVNPIGYLEFSNNKILRSEVLRFIDDHRTGEVERQLRGLPKRRTG